MSKGDTYRKVDQKKYDKNYLRIFGDECPVCLGSGMTDNTWGQCPNCDGIGYIKKEKHEDKS